MSSNIKRAKKVAGNCGSPDEEGPRPEWVRLPRSGKRCPFTGLSRSALNGLILGPKPKVASMSLKENGMVRGVRLVRLSSLLAYLDGIALAQQGEGNGE